jgi:hypothetical protein
MVYMKFGASYHQTPNSDDVYFILYCSHLMDSLEQLLHLCGIGNKDIHL